MYLENGHPPLKPKSAVQRIGAVQVVFLYEKKCQQIRIEVWVSNRICGIFIKLMSQEGLPLMKDYLQNVKYGNWSHISKLFQYLELLSRGKIPNLIFLIF